MPATLPGFGHIKRYWDKATNQLTARVLPGEYYVSTHDEMISTVLGSCVSACIRDPVAAVGGMNHFMLPSGTGVGATEGNNAATRYGVFAMEHLINDILKHGGRRGRLEIKLFGGGKVLAAMTDVGSRNIAFVKEFLHTEMLRVVAEDLGGPWPRKVNYFPLSGRVLMKRMQNNHTTELARQEYEYMHSLEERPVVGDIDLF
ncbi:MAG: chemoreceptor glutamine deamidase CheD [Pseudomonadota bacterium]